jgi:hypothetical protein
MEWFKKFVADNLGNTVSDLVKQGVRYIGLGLVTWLTSSSFFGLWSWKSITIGVALAVYVFLTVDIYYYGPRRRSRRSIIDRLYELATLAMFETDGAKAMQIELDARMSISGSLEDEEAAKFSRQEFLLMEGNGSRAMAKYLFALCDRLGLKWGIRPTQAIDRQKWGC